MQKSKLALGTAQFGMHYGLSNKVGKTPAYEVESILNFAQKNGINILDTAIAYGDCERILGEIGIKNFKVITKVEANKLSDQDLYGALRTEIEFSIQRLKISKLHGILIHDFSMIEKYRYQDLLLALNRLKEENLVTKIGVSAYSTDEIFEAHKIAPIDLVQLPFNLVDRRLLSENVLSDLCHLGIETHARSIFFQGLLLMSRSDMQIYFKKWDRHWNSYWEWLQNHADVNPLKVCIQFALAAKGIQKLVIGVQNLSQLEEIINGTKLEWAFDFPNIECQDIDLLNPTFWKLED